MKTTTNALKSASWAILFVLIVPLTQAQQKAVPKWSGRIMVNIVASDTAVKSAAQSYIAREFRALGDVSIVEEKPEYELQVLVLPNQTGTTPVGYTLSTVLLIPVSSRPIDFVVTGKVSNEDRSLLLNYYGSVFKRPTHKVQVGPISTLEKMCREIVTDIDAEEFEPARKLWQKALDSANRN